MKISKMKIPKHGHLNLVNPGGSKQGIERAQFNVRHAKPVVTSVENSCTAEHVTHTSTFSSSSDLCVLLVP